MDAEKHLQFKVTSKKCSDRAKKQPEASPLCVCRQVFLLYKHADESFL